MTKPKKSIFSRDELIKEVKKGTKIGKLIVKAELEYLQAMKNLIQ